MNESVSPGQVHRGCHLPRPSPLLGLAVAAKWQPHGAMLLDAGRNHPSAAWWLRFAAAFKSIADQHRQRSAERQLRVEPYDWISCGWYDRSRRSLVVRARPDEGRLSTPPGGSLWRSGAAPNAETTVIPPPAIEPLKSILTGLTPWPVLPFSAIRGQHRDRPRGW